MGDDKMMINMKKAVVLTIAGIIAILSFNGCQFKRIVPSEGKWYCEELDILMDFDNRDNNRFKGENGYQIDGEFESNVIYFMTNPTYECVFWGDCIFNDGNKITVKEHYTSKNYIFIKQNDIDEDW